jgi:SAM-dependent methyltransferase
MNETSKSIFKKLSDSRYATRYIVGDGIDIGAGQDCLDQYFEFFPLAKSCMNWDLVNGDAQYLNGVSDNSFDFVNSSHCLEHMQDPHVALNNWIRVLKTGGYLLLSVPDEDLYEQGIFPSTYNADHKHTFTIYKRKSWCSNSINLFDLLSNTDYSLQILKIELLDSTYKYRTSRVSRTDQSMTAIGECAIEVILKKL